MIFIQARSSGVALPTHGGSSGDWGIPQQAKIASGVHRCTVCQVLKPVVLQKGYFEMEKTI